MLFLHVSLFSSIVMHFFVVFVECRMSFIRRGVWFQNSQELKMQLRGFRGYKMLNDFKNPQNFNVLTIFAGFPGDAVEYDSVYTTF